EVPLADLRLEADLLELDGTLVPSRFLLLAGLFVLELAVVEELHDGRGGRGSDLHEVVSPLLRGLEGLERGHHAKLTTFFGDAPDMGEADHLVDAQVFAQPGSLTAPLLVTCSSSSRIRGRH